MMIYDKSLQISVGNSRTSIQWQRQELLLSELYEKLKTPLRSTETMAQYLDLKKQEQDNLKDIGGFVAGSLSGPRRKAGAVTGRDIITLDIDNIPNGMTQTVVNTVDALGCGYCIYSTRKHRPDAPRLRILFPIDRTCTADEYEPIARYMANAIGIGMADPTTFEAHRLMYWPSVCADGEYVYYCADKPLLSVAGVLATYADWRDTTSWPTAPGEGNHRKAATKQGDPTEKRGVVGAFCRVYDVPAAMDKFLPGVYAETDTPGRYTYTAGSTTGGAVLYDGGKFLYSHHATDPVSGRLVNAFDLVRLHRFGDQDDDADPKTPTIRLPSFSTMCRLASSDRAVAGTLLREQRQAAQSAFAPTTEGEAPAITMEGEDFGWEMSLKRHERTGLPLSTIDNILIILDNDSNLKDKFALNEFAGRGEVLGKLPWSQKAERRFWEDTDNAGLYWYFEKMYQITGTGKIDNALSLHSSHHAFNEVTDYLNGLEWDAIPRLDTLFIDYLGAKDTAYTRAVTRKAFTAAVTRAMRPGSKYDIMTILSGPQGIGKSTLLDKMSRDWFCDSIRTFEGKEACELLQGTWLVEISELEAFRKTDDARIKQFLSQRKDRFREAYGRHVKDIPRRCVFFGTTNAGVYLRDTTGNRRYWSVDVGVQEPTKNIWTQLDQEIDQLWAEAVCYWKLGEPLRLPDELTEESLRQQEEHREINALEGLIMEWLEKPVPANWQSWPIDKRQVFWGGNSHDESAQHLVPRDRVCALEVWCELLGGYKKDLRKSDTREINAIIESSKDWEKCALTKCGPYGMQRGFKRVEPENGSDDPL